MVADGTPVELPDDEPDTMGGPRLAQLARTVGPGLITGAADDDPSGIATYTQTGAQFGYGQLWTALFLLPFLIAVQEACARIGSATGSGIATVLKRHYRRELVFAVVSLVFVANVINVGADLGALAAATRLLIPVNTNVLLVGFTVLTLSLEVFVSYARYARFLKWLTVSLLAYVLTAFIVREPWGTVLRATFVPHVELSFAFLFIITGVFGTTISPYMFFWQADEEVEEERQRGLIGPDGRLIQGRRLDAYVRGARADTIVGMVASQVATWSIIVVGATVLHANGVTTVKTAADAASALEPLVQTFPHAGLIAKAIFASGIIGLGLLAVPVLAGSAAYVLSEAVNWSAGLDLKLKQAHGFYGALTVATLVGLAMNLLGIDAMKALVVAAVVNGVIAVPLLVLIALIAQNGRIMGGFRSGPLSRVFVWLTAAVMARSAIAMFATLST